MPNSYEIFARFLIAASLALLVGCSHPLEIIGKGDITERLQGVRGCTLEEYESGDARCTVNLVVSDDYIASYEATPRAGWHFVGWEGVCSDFSTPPYCEFSVPQMLVDQFSSIPPLVVPASRAVFARDEPAVGPFRVNTKSGNLGVVQSASLGNGTFAVCWDRETGLAAWKILCRIFGDDGSPVTTEIVVAETSSGIPGKDTSASLGALVDGSFVVVWDQYIGTSGESNLMAMRISSAGSLIGEAFSVTSQPGEDIGAKEVAGLTDGGFVIVWELFDHDPALPKDGVYARRFLANGTPHSPQFQVNTIDGDLLESDAEPDVIALSGSRFFVTWTQRVSGLWSIMGREYLSDMTGLSPLVLNTPALDQHDLARPGPLGSEGVVVSWRQSNTASDEVLLARFMPTVTLAGSDQVIVANGLVEILGPQFTIDSDEARPAQIASGQVVFVWELDKSVLGEDEVHHTYARLFGSDGASPASAFTVSQEGLESTRDSSVVPLASGGFAVIWAAQMTPGGDEDIWARRFYDSDADGTPDFEDPAPLDPSVPNCQLAPNVEIGAPINWSNPGSQSLVSIGQEIESAEFTTTSNPGYLGQVDFVATVGTDAVQRHAWVSECPGGPPLPDPQCEQFGNSVTSLRWAQQPLVTRCDLETNKQYFLNVRNVDCASGNCRVWRNLYNNGSP